MFGRECSVAMQYADGGRQLLSLRFRQLRLRRQRTDLTDLSDLIYFLFIRPLSGFKLAFSLLLFRNNRFRLTSASARKRHAESCMRVIA